MSDRDKDRLMMAKGVLSGELDPEAMSFRDRELLLDDGAFPEARWIAASDDVITNWRAVAEEIVMNAIVNAHRTKGAAR